MDVGADPVVLRGIDVFKTHADGRTFYDFKQNSIPAGFFCKRSSAFTGGVALKGLPLATGTPARMTFVPLKPSRAKGASKLELAGAFTFPGRLPRHLKWIEYPSTNCCPICHDSGTAKAHCYTEFGCENIACTLNPD
jgi:hypothetical protein